MVGAGERPGKGRSRSGQEGQGDLARGGEAFRFGKGCGWWGTLPGLFLEVRILKELKRGEFVSADCKGVRREKVAPTRWEQAGVEWWRGDTLRGEGKSAQGYEKNRDRAGLSQKRVRKVLIEKGMNRKGGAGFEVEGSKRTEDAERVSAWSKQAGDGRSERGK